MFSYTPSINDKVERGEVLPLPFPPPPLRVQGQGQIQDQDGVRFIQGVLINSP